MSLAEKVVIVTGAAGGIGQAYATGLAKLGARILAADIADCEATVEQVRAGGGDAIAARLDVTDAEAARRTAEAALAAFGRIDGLVNNAALYGALHGGRFDTIAEAEWDATMAVNVKGIWNCCKAVVPAMREAGGGSIVNIASLAATYGTPFALHYTTSKAAVIGLSRGLARELGRHEIRVNAVAPSAVLTDATRTFFGERLDRALDVVRTGQSIQRTMLPADLIGTVAWLVSDASQFVTGQTIAVDGGTVMS
ncbi:MAG: SDR family oxidoreductase [Alphaproteobacteria bacterium]|nr:SDR family oxidoreductase [Alphaproteobacteria bacterium]